MSDIKPVTIEDIKAEFFEWSSENGYGQGDLFLLHKIVELQNRIIELESEKSK